MKRISSIGIKYSNRENHMTLNESFDQPYKLSTTKSTVARLLHDKLEDMGCQDISIYKVLDITQTNVYIISYVNDEAIETHIVNENLLMGGTNTGSETFKRAEFIRLIATSMIITTKKVKDHNLPIRFWSDDSRKTNIYTKVISRFKDAEIKEVKNYRTINGDTRTVHLVTKKDKT
jgi:hypothetical protein